MLLDWLAVARADVVGWSDGGTVGYLLAIDAPDRVGRLLAFEAHARHSGLIEGYDETRTFCADVERARQEYADRAPIPTSQGCRTANPASPTTSWQPSRHR